MRDCQSPKKYEWYLYTPLRASQQCTQGQAPVRHIHRATMTYFYHSKSTLSLRRRPRNQLTVHFSAGHRRCLSATTDQGEGREMNRSSKGSMDPRRQTLHHRRRCAAREMPTPPPDSADRYEPGDKWRRKIQLLNAWRGSKSLTGRPVKAFYTTPHENGPTWWRPPTRGIRSGCWAQPSVTCTGETCRSRWRMELMFDKLVGFMMPSTENGSAQTSKKNVPLTLLKPAFRLSLTKSVGTLWTSWLFDSQSMKWEKQWFQ